jgi:hypothetical protein
MGSSAVYIVDGCNQLFAYCSYIGPAIIAINLAIINASKFLDSNKTRPAGIYTVRSAFKHFYFMLHREN